MNSRIVSLTAVLLAALWLPSKAIIIEVPGGQPSIQTGIDASSEGDTVLVARGRYYENVKYRGKGVVLASHFINTGNLDDIDSTIIDGSQPFHPDTASCVLIYSSTAADSSDTSSALIGFTVTGGMGTVWPDRYVPGTSNVEGGGLLIEYQSPRIRHNIFVGNRAMIKAGCFDGAGGAIKCTAGNPDISNNCIVLNQSSDHAGGVLLWHSSARVKNNLIAYNRAGGTWGGGGGMCIDVCQERSVILANNTIAFNRAGAGNGGGIHIWDSSPIIANCILWANQASQILLEGGTPAVTYSNVQGGYAGLGNIDQDPFFLDDRCHLSAVSPAVDAGDPEADYFDPEGSPGTAQWPSCGGLRNDMGVYGGPGRRDMPELPPFIAATIPEEGAVRVPFDATLVIAFSRPMDTTSLDISLNDSSIAMDRLWNSNRDTISLSHVDLFANFTRYWLRILGGRSGDGRDLPILPDSFSFRTMDTVRPVLSATQPSHGQIGVAVNALIKLWFSKPVGKSSLTYDFSDTSFHFTIYQTNDSLITLAHSTKPFAGGTTYTLELTAFQDTAGNPMGQSLVPNPFSFTTVVTGVEGFSEKRPEQLRFSIYPNPAEGQQAIRFVFGLNRNSSVTLEVFDICGRRLLCQKRKNLPAGIQQIAWDRTGDDGRKLNSGCYFCRLRTVDWTAVRRLTVFP